MTSTLTRSGLPVLDADPFSPEVLADPLSFQEQLREAGPVVVLAKYGVYALGRYAEVKSALTDWQSFESGAGVGLTNFRTEKPWRPPSLLLEADPPHHDAPRSVLAKILGPRQIAQLREAWEADAADLVDTLLARARGGVLEFDGVAELSGAYPLRVFPDAVGIASEGRENLLPYGDMAFNAFGPHNALVERDADRVESLSLWVNAHCARDALTGTGFGAQIWEAADRGDITHEQAPLIVRSLLTAGVDTTVNGIGAFLHAVATHPDAWARLRREPELIRGAFDETVRVESPVQSFFRTATRDVEIGGTIIPEGAKLVLFLGSANHDPRRWEDPHIFSLDRDPSGHVGYGFGIHQCVGQHVARAEAAAVLGALARRVKSIELAGSPVRHLNNTLRSWKSLPLRMALA
ncbi:cytochrome P450 [Pseudarthrobacter sp. LMD1-1-1.1]|uniref:cytochrome P450 n=1 Tax=Pseudarthrobacter sp. LMD1-1-1.1 TaxID=3135242 RepID=UPI0034400969